MNYYQQKLYLPEVDKNDRIIRPVERWLAHKQGILHRGFTVILVYDNQLILQQRRHPVFDRYFDLSFSSHPILINNQLQTMEKAIFQTLKREWNLEKEELKADLKFLDKIYYQAKDPKTIYSEHEIDYLYFIELKKLPQPNPNFAYGYKLVNKNQLTTEFGKAKIKLAPWVSKIIENKSFQEF